jgi:repressor of nif and glnA expression
MICTIKDYTESVTTTEERIDRYKAILLAMENGLTSFVSNAGVQMHKLNGGQVTIETNYRSMKEYIDGIKNIQYMINYYTQKLTGSVTYLRPFN